VTRPARRQSSVATRPAVRRAAVYVRVSTDEQAALEFNSLQAQEQICKTYITMRDADPAAPERWTHSQTYSDPGYSGGTLDRPALKRLMADIETGQVNTLLVYKIDRLSRSIHQFYRIWEILEHYGVDLVSATQDLNTSTSQGKLMLNMLLSFGQFEREQISERTRDKIRAARLRGKWTGGPVPLGYDLKDGRLVPNEIEAAVVREVFDVYLRTLSLTRTVEDVGRRGLTMKTGAHRNGTGRSGRSFDKPSLLRVLRNPIYAGFTRCNGSLARGEHEGIVGRETWERVQDRLTRNGSAGYQGGEREDSQALLKGLLYCAPCQCRMTPSYTTKGNRRHRYYVCQTRLRKGAHACPTGRVAAHVIEKRVVEQIRAIGRDPQLIAETVRQARLQQSEQVARFQADEKALRRELLGKRASLKRLLTKGDDAAGIGAIRERITAIETRLAALAGEIEAAKQATITEEGVRSALEAFGPVWEALWPGERARILSLLTRRIDYDGQAGKLGVWLALEPSRLDTLVSSR
jgi:site-specific DNA recombinase